jgi:hypothetical protein
MARTTHSARITGPVDYLTTSGKPMTIPRGPCLVEQGDGQPVDIVWGASGQNSTLLPPEDLASAERGGHLLLLD